MNILRQNNIYGNRVAERALNAKLLENLKKKKAEEDSLLLTEKLAGTSHGQKEDSIEISSEGRLAAGQVRDALGLAEPNSDETGDKGISDGQDEDILFDEPGGSRISDGQDDKAVSGEQDETASSEKQGGKVAVNEGKRLRQIAAAKSRGQVQQVLALLQKDLSDCKAGLEKGWCDESEIAKVEALISRARERMSQVPQESQENQGGLDEFAMASLM